MQVNNTTLVHNAVRIEISRTESGIFEVRVGGRLHSFQNFHAESDVRELARDLLRACSLDEPSGQDLRDLFNLLWAIR